MLKQIISIDNKITKYNSCIDKLRESFGKVQELINMCSSKAIKKQEKLVARQIKYVEKYDKYVEKINILTVKKEFIQQPEYKQIRKQELQIKKQELVDNKNIIKEICFKAIPQSQTIEQLETQVDKIIPIKKAICRDLGLTKTLNRNIECMSINIMVKMRRFTKQQLIQAYDVTAKLTNFHMTSLQEFVEQIIYEKFCDIESIQELETIRRNIMFNFHPDRVDIRNLNPQFVFAYADRMFWEQLQYVRQQQEEIQEDNQNEFQNDQDNTSPVNIGLVNDVVLSISSDSDNEYYED